MQGKVAAEGLALVLAEAAVRDDGALVQLAHDLDLGHGRPLALVLQRAPVCTTVMMEVFVVGRARRHIRTRTRENRARAHAVASVRQPPAAVAFSKAGVSGAAVPWLCHSFFATSMRRCQTGGGWGRLRSAYPEGVKASTQGFLYLLSRHLCSCSQKRQSGRSAHKVRKLRFSHGIVFCCNVQKVPGVRKKGQLACSWAYG